MIDMALFTGAYTNPLAVSPDTTIQAAMDATQLTLSSGGSPNVNNLAMTVVIITGSEGTFDHPWAGLRANETHYAASLVKIASMYAAFDMRSSADILVTDQGLTSWPDIEAALVADFNPEIDTNTPTGISGSPLLRPEDKTRKPNYAGMLQPGSGGCSPSTSPRHSWQRSRTSWSSSTTPAQGRQSTTWATPTSMARSPTTASLTAPTGSGSPATTSTPGPPRASPVSTTWTRHRARRPSSLPH